MDVCKIDYCDYPVWAKAKGKGRGYCGSHYKRFIRYGDPEIRQGPGRDHVERECSVDGCAAKAIARGWCNAHYLRWKKYGSVDPRPKPGPRKTVLVDRYVYVYAPDHPNAMGTGRVAEHVMVMSEVLGRPLRKGESVHHRNGVRTDNRPENLELWLKSQPAGQRVVDLVEWARSILDTYAEEASRDSVRGWSA